MQCHLSWMMYRYTCTAELPEGNNSLVGTHEYSDTTALDLYQPNDSKNALGELDEVMEADIALGPVLRQQLYCEEVDKYLYTKYLECFLTSLELHSHRKGVWPGRKNRMSMHHKLYESMLQKVK